MPPVKLFILAVLAMIVASLGSAVVYLVRGREQDRRKMARALTMRISLSIALLLFVIVAAQLGWITPHGLVPPAPASNP
jgi:formate/nitrite transporter FocA (FNT family)